MKMGVDPDFQNEDGGTALGCVVGNGHYEAVMLLLNHGADPSGPGWIDTSSVMAEAKQNGDAKMVALLRKAGAK